MSFCSYKGIGMLIQLKSGFVAGGYSEVSDFLRHEQETDFQEDGYVFLQIVKKAMSKRCFGEFKLKK